MSERDVRIGEGGQADQSVPEHGLAGSASWWWAPMNRWSTRGRALAAALATSLTALFSVVLERRLQPPFDLPDAAMYLRMAEGHTEGVPQPFASRPLAPMLAHGLATLTHVPVRTGFAELAWIALLVTLVTVFGLAVRSSAPRWVLVAIAGVAFWPQSLHDLAMPDLPFAALLCGLLLCLAAGRVYGAALMLFPLMLARESTSLVLLCLLLVSWRQLRWGGSLLALGSTVAGALVVRHFSLGAAGNPEHLPEVVYLAAKLPWNFLRAFGVVPWSNLYPVLCAPPPRQVALHLGSLRSVGVCAVAPLMPRQAVLAYLTTFGLLPLALLRPGGGGKAQLREADLLVRFCLLYGGISFLLAPGLGTWYNRLLGYGWPLLLVAVPRWFRGAGRGEERVSGARGERWGGLGLLLLLAIHLTLAVLGSWRPWPWVFYTAAALGVLATGLILFPRRAGWRAGDGPGAAPPAW